MSNYKYYIGPWIKDNEQNSWIPPKETIGSICFGSLPQCGISPTIQDSRPNGFFAVDPNENLGLDWLLIGQGDCREIIPNGNIKNSVVSLMGQTEGLTIADWLAYWLFESGSYDGQDKWKIGTPTKEGDFEIHLGGHSKIWSRKFGGVGDKSWNRLKDLLKYDLQRHDDECKNEAKKLRDEAKELRKQKKNKEASNCDLRAGKVKYHAESVLDAMCRKYRCLPSELSQTIRRGKAQTTIQDDFTRADGDTIGNQLTWTATQGGWTTVSNSIKASEWVYSSCRAESDLAGADHTAQAVLTSDWAIAGTCIRFSASALTFYVHRPILNANSTQYTSKWVSGTQTMLWSDNYDAPSGATFLTGASGSTINGKVNGTECISLTDTAITAGTRAGILAYTGYGYDLFADDFYATDWIAAGNPKNIFRGISFSGPFERAIL